MSDNTEHVQHLLSEYLDALLPEQEHLTVAEHIKDCAECEKRFQELARLRTMLHEQPTLTPPAGFYAQVVKKIKGEGDTVTDGIVTAVPFKVLISACVVMVVVWVSIDGLDRFKPSRREMPLPVTPAAIPEKPLVDQKVRGLTKVESEKDARFNPTTEPPIQAPPAAALSMEETKALPKTSPAQKTRQSSATRKSSSLAKRKNRAEALQAKNTGGISSEASSFGNAKQDLLLKPQPTDHKAKLVALESSMDKSLPSEFVEWKGMDSRIKKHRTYVIQSPAQMKDLWNKHSPNTPAPAVDFEQYQVVGITTGLMHVSGTGFEIIGSRDTVDTTVVYYRERKDMFRAQPSVSGFRPYHFKVIPKSKHPVKFQQI